jgi:hypothetical protein
MRTSIKDKISGVTNLIQDKIGGVTNLITGNENIRKSIVGADFGNTLLAPTPTESVLAPTPTESVITPEQTELDRQITEVRLGNVNPAQAEYFKQQNEGVNYDGDARKMAKMGSPSVNPVSNRSNEGFDNLMNNLYGDKESRGIL